MSGVPNFGATARAGVNAYIEYINNVQGGVCGRTLRLETADDRFDPAVNRAATEQLKDRVFAFVGNTTVEDDGGAGVIGNTNVPNCSLAIGDTAIKASNYFSPNPIDPDGQTNGTIPIWNYFKSAYGITKVGVVYAKNVNAQARTQAFVNDIQAAGLAVSGPHQVEVTETNYAPVKERILNDGADSVIIVHEVNGAAKLALAFNNDPQIKVAYWGAQVYGNKFIELAGSAAEGSLIAITHDTNENPESPGMQAFVEWMNNTAPNVDKDFFAIIGWAAADLCVKAMRAAGPTPTRDQVIDALKSMTSWDADGMLAPRDPANKVPPQGFAVVTVQGGTWKKIYPAGGFATG